MWVAQRNAGVQPCTGAAQGGAAAAGGAQVSAAGLLVLAHVLNQCNSNPNGTEAVTWLL